ncbi:MULTISPECIES: hypothetical protein [Candidatus Ichthyocystis]|uniref:Uncharacterized protein n=1 Tax=Candidatus Ichthyocystis hellenicum TaxID=1561003 RepID=A0A0S4M2F8_9BURK|nr:MULTISPECIES: hypothetical protein [Ichthyocystis]CUT17955.1 hypothetical protein Ark11_1142 [Candidatus Ichthyocystis hellenicum]
MDSARSITLNEKYQVKDKTYEDIVQVSSEGSNIIGSDITCRSTHYVSGISISSGITQIDPELVDSDSVADIVHSIENSRLSKYLCSMDKFTANFMTKSLQYVRSFRLDPYYSFSTNPTGDAYLDYGQHQRSSYVREFVVNPSDYNADINVVRNHVLSEPIDEIYEKYGRLQYICDYFKYYILENQFECLPHSKKYEAKSLPILSAIKAETKKDIRVNFEFATEEVVIDNVYESNYDSFIASIESESQDFMRKNISSAHVNNIKLLKIRYLDSLNRDTLIKCLMEYYLLIMDKFESMADLKFKYRDDITGEKVVLPVPREVAELVNEEIGTGRTTYNYNINKPENFFCDGNRCLCPSNFRNKHAPEIDPNVAISSLKSIRSHVMDEVVNRMKLYILSLNR